MTSPVRPDWVDGDSWQPSLGAWTLEARVEAIAERGREALAEQGVVLDG